MESSKLNNDCVDDNKKSVLVCAIFDKSHERNAAAKQLIRLPTDKSHADNENDVTFCDVTNNGCEICISK